MDEPHIYRVKFLSPKLVIRSGYACGKTGYIETYGHYCPACKQIHDIAVNESFSNGAKWTFDGNVLLPTFGPSINIRVGPSCDDPKHIDICHYFIIKGVIQYQGDCTHDLKGQHISIPDIPVEAVRWATIVENSPYV